MDGSENLTATSESLTSTTMGSVLARNANENSTENATANDSLPSSSSDANIAARTVTQEDPISSTSEEVGSFKKQTVVQQSDSNTNMEVSSEDQESANTTKQVNISDSAKEPISKNFDDIANELENLLEESAEEYKFTGKSSKTSIDDKDMNLDWELDCEYSISNKKSNFVNATKAEDDEIETIKNTETPSSSAEIVLKENSEDSKLENNVELDSVQNDCADSIEPDKTSIIEENIQATLVLDEIKSAEAISEGDASKSENDTTNSAEENGDNLVENNEEIGDSKTDENDVLETANEVIESNEISENESQIKSPHEIQTEETNDAVSNDDSTNAENEINTADTRDQLVDNKVSTGTEINETDNKLAEKIAAVDEMETDISNDNPEIITVDKTNVETNVVDIDETKDVDIQEETVEKMEENVAETIEVVDVNVENETHFVENNEVVHISENKIEENAVPSDEVTDSSEIINETVESAQNKSPEGKEDNIEVTNEVGSPDEVNTNADISEETADKIEEIGEVENSEVTIQQKDISPVVESDVVSEAFKEDSPDLDITSSVIDKESRELTENVTIPMALQTSEVEKLQEVTEKTSTDTIETSSSNIETTDTTSSNIETSETTSCNIETSETTYNIVTSDIISSNTESTENITSETTDNVDSNVVSSASTISFIDSEDCVPETLGTQSTLATTETASNSSALIITGENRNLPPVEVVMEPDEQVQETQYEEVYQPQEEDSFSQSYESYEEDTLESALIKAAEDAEHTRREIKAKQKKQMEEEQARQREQAELLRKQREKSRLDAEKARKQMEEEEQRERDLLNKQIEDQKRMKEEKRLAEEKIKEEKRLAVERVKEEKRLAAEKIKMEKRLAQEKIKEDKRLAEERLLEQKRLEEERLNEETRLAEEKLIEEKRLAEETKLADEKRAIEEQKLAEQRKLEEKRLAEEAAINAAAAKTVIEEMKVLKPLNIVVEEIPDRSTNKEEPPSEQPSESEEDNKPEYSSKMVSQESLKMTITKNKTDEPETILKLYDPQEEQQELSIRKLKIKPVVEEIVPKITFKNIPEKALHSPKRSLRNLSPNRPQSPKVTIKPVKPDSLSPLKLTIKTRKSDEADEPQHNSPKITIKPIVNPEEENSFKDAERSGSPKVTKEPIKLNIKYNKREQSPKNTRSSAGKTEHHINPKITIKPVIKPQEVSHELEPERIVLKINKSNYQNIESQQLIVQAAQQYTRKRESHEDIERLAKIKLKVSKTPGHARIVNEEMEALKRSLPEGIELVDIKRPKMSMPSHTQGGATITPIMKEQVDDLQEELSSDSVIFVGEEDPLPTRQGLIVTPVKVPTLVTPVTTPTPKKRGRPRKVPLEPMDDLQLQHHPQSSPSPSGMSPSTSTPSSSSSNLLLMHHHQHHSLLDQGGHFLLASANTDPSDDVTSSTGGAEEEGLVLGLGLGLGLGSSGRPKRSCRGPSAHTQLGIKPRKPRGGGGIGVGRGRGGRGRGSRGGGLRGGGIEKAAKLDRLSDITATSTSTNLTPTSLLTMTDAFDRQDIAIRILDPASREHGPVPPTTGGGGGAGGGRGSRRGRRGSINTHRSSTTSAHSMQREELEEELALEEEEEEDSDDNDEVITGGVVSGSGGLEIIPRYADEVIAMEEEEEEEDEDEIDGLDGVKGGHPEKDHIGFLASGIIDITTDDSLPPDDSSSMEVEAEGEASTSSTTAAASPQPQPQPPSANCNMQRQLKIVIGRSDQIDVTDERLVMSGKDIVIYEEETRMSAEMDGGRGAAGKQISPAIDPLAGIPADLPMPVDENTQSSMQSTATTESTKTAAGATSAAAPVAAEATVKTPRQRNIYRNDLGADLEALVAITQPEQLAEYHWGGDGPFMLQEQIAEYLGVKSFKRKYPNIIRRTVDMHERDYIRENGLASEAMCNLGLTVLNSADVLDIMYSDFQVKYEEYCKHRRDKEAKEIMNRQRAINLAASQERTKQDLVQTAISSAAQWNARLNRTRREQRPACMDLQTFTINYAKGQRKVIDKGRMGHYPLALVPGQYTDYYQTYTPTEINNLPFNTMLYSTLPHTDENEDSGSESDTSNSDTGTDSSSGSSGSSSSSSSDEDDQNTSKSGHNSPHRSPVQAPSGKRLLAAA